MTTSLRDKPIQSDADLMAVWKELMGDGGFGRRSLWLIFLDEEGRRTPVVVPIDDVPEEPDPQDIALIANMVRRIQTDMDVHSVPMLLSRPGPTWMVDSDRRWAKALHEALADLQPQWPLHLATTDEVQVFAPDDLTKMAGVARSCHTCGMARIRVSTTVDQDLLEEARRARGASSTDSALVEAALRALIADHRAAEIERAYAVYDDQPLSDPDEWGDLDSFHQAVSRSRSGR